MLQKADKMLYGYGEFVARRALGVVRDRTQGSKCHIGAVSKSGRAPTHGEKPHIVRFPKVPKYPPTAEITKLIWVPARMSEENPNLKGLFFFGPGPRAPVESALVTQGGLFFDPGPHVPIPRGRGAPGQKKITLLNLGFPQTFLQGPILISGFVLFQAAKNRCEYGSL